jgi:class 3 adenylate cyclase
MDFVAVIEQAKALLQSKGRLTYRTLQRQFALDDEALEDLKDELLFSDAQITEAEGRGLVWNNETKPSEETPVQTANAPATELPTSAPSSQPDHEVPSGERRQLTVMFCDLVGSTALSEQLDPEELQALVRTYQEVSAQVIERYEGYIAQYLGDGLLVYFGYPQAHEDDAARAIRAGLEIVSALDQARSQFPQPVHVRIGIHTGPVVVGQMGGGNRHEQLALGETPNIAARVQGEAQPDEVVISAATQRLVAGLFEIEDRGHHELKGISLPLTLSRVTGEGTARSRFDVAVQHGLTPLVGRELEAGFLAERWEQAQVGAGQAVLLSGEPGIGKSRLTSELRAQVEHDEQAVLSRFSVHPIRKTAPSLRLLSASARFFSFAPRIRRNTRSQSSARPSARIASRKRRRWLSSRICYHCPLHRTVRL